MSGKDYSAAEVETLAELATTTLLDDWHSWSAPPAKPDDLAWHLDPDLAMANLDARRRYRRLNDACKRLYKRGLVERRKFGELGPGWFYRLIPPLRLCAGGECRAHTSQVNHSFCRACESKYAQREAMQS